MSHSHTNLANFWSLSVSLALPSSNHFRLFSLFEQFRFHNAFAFLRQAEERYQVQQDCAGRSSDCRTSNHWRALYPYHHCYYYFYYNKNKWAVLVNGFGCSIFGIWGDSQGKWGGCWSRGGCFWIARFAEFAALSWRSNRCVSPFVVFNNPLWVFESTTYWPFHAKISWYRMKLSSCQGNDQEVYVWKLAQPLRKFKDPKVRTLLLLFFWLFRPSVLLSFHHPSWGGFSLIPFVVRVIHWPSLSLVVSLPLLSDFFPW